MTEDLRAHSERVLAQWGMTPDEGELARGVPDLLSRLEAAEQESARRLGLVGDSIKQTDQQRMRAETAERERDKWRVRSHAAEVRQDELEIRVEFANHGI